MARLVGSMGTVELFERLLIALLKQQGVEPDSRIGGHDNGKDPSEKSSCKIRFEQGQWINFGYDERSKKGIGQITFPYYNMEKFIAKLENNGNARNIPNSIQLNYCLRNGKYLVGYMLDSEHYEIQEKEITMALFRKFKDKVYHFDSQHRDMTGGRLHAVTKANKIRKDGDLARITTEGSGMNRVWIVWSRER